MPKRSPSDDLQPREPPLWSREAALWACLPRSLRGVSHTVYGKLPGGSGNGYFILAHSGGHGFSNFPHAIRVSCSELVGCVTGPWLEGYYLFLPVPVVSQFGF